MLHFLICYELAKDDEKLRFDLQNLDIDLSDTRLSISAFLLNEIGSEDVDRNI